MSELNEAGPGLAYEVSLAVALSTGAVSRYCYANARHACDALTAWPDLCLVEGWLVLEQTTQVTLIEHAWCEHSSSPFIVDPSIVLLVPRRFIHLIHYFAGVRRTRVELQTLAGCDLPYVRSSGNYGPDGMRHADYRAAHVAAHTQATLLADASPAKAVVIQSSAFPTAEQVRHDLVVQIVSSQDFLHRTRE